MGKKRKKIYHLNWKNDKNMISEKCEFYLKSYLDQIQGFNNLSEKDIKKLRDKVHIKLNDKQLNSIRRIQLFQRMMIDSKKAQKLADRLYREYKHGKSIETLSMRYRLSPMTIMSKILKIKYKKSIKHTKKLDVRDTKEMTYARKNDALMGNPQQIRKHSQQFEYYIQDYFIHYNIPITTEDELQKVQQKKYGRAINTPDLIFNDPININGKLVKWLDCKNYYGSIVNMFLIKKNQKQVDKYNKKWGPGALLFSLGFNRDLGKKIKNVLLLDFVNDVNSAQILK